MGTSRMLTKARSPARTPSLPSASPIPVAVAASEYSPGGNCRTVSPSVSSSPSALTPSGPVRLTRAPCPLGVVAMRTSVPEAAFSNGSYRTTPISPKDTVWAAGSGCAKAKPKARAKAVTVLEKNGRQERRIISCASQARSACGHQGGVTVKPHALLWYY